MGTLRFGKNVINRLKPSIKKTTLFKALLIKNPWIVTRGLLVELSTRVAVPVLTEFEAWFIMGVYIKAAFYEGNY
jgi:hypothetical protein